MIELEDVIKIIEKNVLLINRVKIVNFIDVVNKVVVEDIYLIIDSFLFDRLFYDGYVYNVNFENRNLKVIGILYVGDVFNRVLNKNEVVKIMIGGKIL